MHNELLLDYIGKSKTKNLTNEIQKLLLEDHQKICSEKPMSLIDVHDPNSNEILQIGSSVPSDLILDNFGRLMNGMIGMGALNGFLNDAGNPVAGVINANSQSLFNWGRNDDHAPDTITPVGTKFRLGASTNAPTRTDFALNTLLAGAPENAYQVADIGGFNSGLGTVTNAKNYPNAGGNGTIAEIGLFYQFRVSSGFTLTTIMLTHDLVSPVVNYSVGQVINVEIVFTL